MGLAWTVIAVIVVAQILQAVATWAAKAAIEQRIKSHFDRDIEGLKALLQTKSAHEKELIVSYVQKSWELSEYTATITYQTCQLMARVVVEMQSGRENKLHDNQISQKVHAFYKKEASPILETAMLLKKYYALLPANVIMELQQFETAIWNILRWQETEKGLMILLECNDKLLESLRRLNADLLEGTAIISNLLRETPPRGFVPDYVRAAVSS